MDEEIKTGTPQLAEEVHGYVMEVGCDRGEPYVTIVLRRTEDARQLGAILYQTVSVRLPPVATEQSECRTDGMEIAAHTILAHTLLHAGAISTKDLLRVVRDLPTAEYAFVRDYAGLDGEVDADVRRLGIKLQGLRHLHKYLNGNLYMIDRETHVGVSLWILRQVSIGSAAVKAQLLDGLARCLLEPRSATELLSMLRALPEEDRHVAGRFAHLTGDVNDVHKLASALDRAHGTRIRMRPIGAASEAEYRLEHTQSSSGVRQWVLRPL